MAVDLHRFGRHRTVEPGQTYSQQAGDLADAHDGPHRGPLDAAAVAQEDDVRREEVEQTLQISSSTSSIAI
jgi:hypothetical protein